jgi:hypothetical protein
MDLQTCSTAFAAHRHLLLAALGRVQQKIELRSIRADRIKFPLYSKTKLISQ